jgi:DNA repair protein RadD
MTGLLFPSLGALRPLRLHQEHALESLRASLASGHRRPMLQAPTGFGKTLTAAHIIQRALDKGKRVAFTVPALSLIDQTVAAVEAEGIHCIGVLQGLHPRTDREQPLQICSVQTLAHRGRPEVDIVIVDEAHELHKEIFRWMADRPDLLFVGLSATPWSRGLGKYYDDLIITSTTKSLIDQAYLSPFKVFAPSQPDLAGVSTVAGDFHEGQLAEAIDQPKLVGDVVQTWLARGQDRPTLCYGVNRAHAEHLQQRFIEAGVAAEYIDCFTDRTDRERIFDGFRACGIKVICNVATLATGLDLPMVACLIDAKPTKSEIRFVQTIGRGLRTALGKDHLLIFDHAGNHLRLGLVTDIHHERLDAGERRKSAAEAGERAKPLPRLCQGCSAVLPQSAKVCPECGKVREVRTEIEHRDGELIEVGSRPTKRNAAQTLLELEDFYGELRWIASVRGYAPGWAGHKFRERFGLWPNDWQVRLAQPREPSLKTKNWLRSRQIAFAKARASG